MWSAQLAFFLHPNIIQITGSTPAGRVLMFELAQREPVCLQLSSWAGGVPGQLGGNRGLLGTRCVSITGEVAGDAENTGFSKRARKKKSMPLYYELWALIFIFVNMTLRLYSWSLYTWSTHIAACLAATLSVLSAWGLPFSAAGSLAPSVTQHICNINHKSMCSLSSIYTSYLWCIHAYLTSLSLKVTQSLILAAFSSMIFASWALTKIYKPEKFFNIHFMDINGHFCSASDGSGHTCFSSCISNLFITASFSWTWLVRSWYFLYNELSDSLVCMFADFSFSSMTWIWKAKSEEWIHTCRVRRRLRFTWLVSFRIRIQYCAKVLNYHPFISALLGKWNKKKFFADLSTCCKARFRILFICCFQACHFFFCPQLVKIHHIFKDTTHHV